MDNFSLELPFWTIILPFFAGLAYAMILYYRDKRFLDKSPRFRLLLAGLRFVAVSILVFLLLGPYISSIMEERSKPSVLIAQDASESVLFNNKSDSAKIINAIKTLKKDLSDRYEVELVHFGESVQAGMTDTFDQKITNYSQLMQYIDQQYQGRSLASVVMLTDGIFNEGENPIYSKTLQSTAFQTIALGDTVKKSDIALKNVLFNDLAFLGDKINIQFNLTAFKLQGSSTKVSILEVTGNEKKLLGEKPVPIQNDDYFFSDNFVIDADKPGTKHYQIIVRSVPNELTYANNVKDIFIDVIDSRINIAIIAHAPHPDLSAIRQSLESLKNYKVTIEMAESNPSTGDADMIILHNLPSNRYPVAALLKSTGLKKVPHLFIVGQQTDLNALNKAQELVQISSNIKSSNESQAALNKLFSGFELDPQTGKAVELFPPLLAPFGTFKSAPYAQTLLFQNISKVRTEYPLLSFGDRNGLKNGMLLGEGVWKWRLFDFAQNGNQNSINQLLGKTIQLIATKTDTRKWRVEPFKTVYNENERIQFRANLYNDNNEPVNHPEAFMYIKNAAGEVFEYVFSRAENAYSLDAAYLPAGTYTYRSTVNLGGKEHTDVGQFVIKVIQLETADLVARHDLLRQMGEMSGGKLYSMDQLEELRKNLLDADVKPVVYAQRKTSPLINFKWLFFGLLLLLGAEWFLRRYFGSY